MGIWKGMGSALHKGADYYEKQKLDECLNAWEPAWEQLKKNVVNAEIRPELYEVDEATDFEYAFEEWISDMVTAYMAAKYYEEAIRFCKEVIETFPWKQTAPNEFNRFIGIALDLQGKKEESDAWFEEWMKREPDNYESVFECAIHLAGRDQKERAEQLVEDMMKEMECNYETHIIFMKAASFFSAIENKERESYYRNIEKAYFQNFLNDPVEYGSQDIEDDLPFYIGQDMSWEEPLEPIVKEKKIYPNDPCPCGSGKKYKKCCGKN